jgi:hypothetical protein
LISQPKQPFKSLVHHSLIKRLLAACLPPCTAAGWQPVLVASLRSPTVCKPSACYCLQARCDAARLPRLASLGVLIYWFMRLLVVCVFVYVGVHSKILENCNKLSVLNLI